MPREAVVEPTAEGCVIVTNASCQPIECDNIFDNMLIVLHDNVVKLVLGVPDWVKSAEIRMEVTFKVLKISHPGGHGVLGENVRLEPFQSGAPEVQESKVDALHICSECVRTIVIIALPGGRGAGGATWSSGSLFGSGAGMCSTAQGAWIPRAMGGAARGSTMCAVNACGKGGTTAEDRWG